MVSKALCNLDVLCNANCILLIFFFFFSVFIQKQRRFGSCLGSSEKQQMHYDLSQACSGFTKVHRRRKICFKIQKKASIRFPSGVPAAASKQRQSPTTF